MIDLLRWTLTEGMALKLSKWAEDVNARRLLFTPVSKIKDTPISGDALADYRKYGRGGYTGA